MKRIPFALAAAATLSLAQPALAMESDTFAGDAPEAAPVVSVRVDDSDPDEGVCTGTAIDPHWVITARHCVDAAAKPGGSVRTGQGDEQRVYKVDRHEVAPRGDIALLHTQQEMQLSRFAEVADTVPSGDATIYGWSSDGTGGTTRLPSAQAQVEGESELALYDAPTALRVGLKHGARIQPGDSGGAVFSGGKVAGVMSAGLFEDPENPTEREMTSNAAVAVAPVADQAQWIRDVVAGEAAEDEAADAGTAASTAAPRWVWAVAVLAAVGVAAAAAASASTRRGATAG